MAEPDPPGRPEATPTWIARLFLIFAVGLIPWIVYLSVSLPSRHISRHYNVSWVGFDIFLVLVMSRTAWLAFHQRRQADLPAVATATLLLVDAWFDITTASPGWPQHQAILLAVFVELPTAALALSIPRRLERGGSPPVQREWLEGTLGPLGTWLRKRSTRLLSRRSAARSEAGTE